MRTWFPVDTLIGECSQQAAHAVGLDPFCGAWAANHDVGANGEAIGAYDGQLAVAGLDFRIAGLMGVSRTGVAFSSDLE